MRKNCFGLRERRNSQGAGLILWCFATLAPLLGISGCTGMVNAQKPGAQSAVQVVPAAVNFGSSGVGKVVTQTATVANTGATPITLTQASVSTTEFSISGLKFPVVIAAGQRAGFTVSFKGAKAGKINGVLNFHGDSWLSDPVELSGDVGNNSPQLNISSSNHNFGNVTVNTVASAALTVTNSGNADLKISNVSVTGATFAAAGIKLPAVVAAGQNAVFEVSFSPKSAGSYMGTVSIASNDPESPTTKVELKGAATTESVGKLTATPAVLSFSSVKVGSSVSGTTILRNAGNANITLSKIDVNAAGFSVAGVATPVLMVPGENLALTVKFSPNAAGTKSGTIALVNAQGGITSVSVSGTTAAAPPPPPATSSLTVSPGSINFGSVVAGVANTQSVQISNSGTGSVSVTAANITGAGFSTSGLNLPMTLNSGQSSTFNVQFNPRTAGASAGNLAITSNASITPHTIALTGTGVAAGMTLSVNPSNVSFGSVTVGNSATRTITVTNTGNSNVAISSASVSGSRLTLMGGSAVTLAPSQSIALTVQFAPTSAGAVNGSVSIASNASGSPAAISVAGTGVTQAQHTVSLSWDASASASGYNVYRSLSSGSGYARLTNGLDAALSYSDNTVQSGQTYFYVTTAVDSAGKESGYSTEVSANIP